MKVKVGELKTHLSKYLRQLEEDGETLEVCVRETPVAYITPVGKSCVVAQAKKLELAGVRVTQQGKDGVVPINMPSRTRKPRKTFNSVESMRREKDW